MENLINFTNAEIGTVRTLVIENEPCFVAKDVAEILGYCDTQSMTRRLDSDEQKTYTDNSSGQGRNITIIMFQK